MLIGAGLVGAAAIYFWPGSTLTLEWVDEGMIVYPSWRVALDEVPYRDFLHAFGPSLFFLNGALFRWFGTDLLVIRISLVVVKALLAGLVYGLARCVARPAFAFAAYAVFVAVWGTPVWVFNAPYASHYTVLCLLAGLFVALAAGDRPAAWLLAGLACGVGVTFKHTTGGLGFLALLLFLSSKPATQAGGGRRAWIARLGVLGASAGVVVVYVLWTPMNWSSAVLVAPALAAIVMGMLHRPPAVDTQLVTKLGLASAGMALPVLAYVALYVRLGAVRALANDTLLELPRYVSWFVPLEPPSVFALVTGALLSGALVAFGRWQNAFPRTRVAIGVTIAVAFVAAVASVPGGSRIGVWQQAVSAVLQWLPVMVAYGSLVVLWRTRGASLLDWHAVLMLVGLYPSADLPHAAALLPAFLPPLARAAGRLHARAPSRLVTAVLASAAFAIAVPPVLLLAETHALRPRGDGLPHASRVWQRGTRFTDTARLVAALDARAAPGSPLLALPSQQTLYFVAGRPSALQNEEFVFYLVSFGLITDADARVLADEDTMLDRLATTRPLVVRYAGEAALGRTERAFPRLRQYLADHYEAVETIGAYTVLTPSRAAAEP